MEAASRRPMVTLERAALGQWGGDGKTLRSEEGSIIGW